MSQSPETDAKAKAILDYTRKGPPTRGENPGSMREHAAEMEKQRNDTMRQGAYWMRRATLAEDQLERIAKEGFGMDDTIGGESAADYVLRMLGKIKATGTESRVCADIAARQQVGIKKYRKTVEGNPLPLRAWLQHGYEEKLDDVIYNKRAIEELDEVVSAIESMWVIDAPESHPGNRVVAAVLALLKPNA